MPRGQPAQQREYIFRCYARLDDLQRHTGAGRFSRSGAVKDERLIVRQLSEP
jgi:hypothetical protein